MIAHLCASFLIVSSVCGSTILREHYQISPGHTIPDADLNGITATIDASASSIGSTTNVTAQLTTSGGWNGDLYAYVSHGGQAVVLLNRIGRTASTPDGSSESGMTATFDDAASQDIHTTTGPLIGTYQPDGRIADPSSVLDTSPRTDTLSDFDGLNGTGNWHFFLADNAGGDEATLSSAGLNIEGQATLVSGGLIKSGLHTTEIVGASEFTGPTVINQGTLVAQAAGALGSTSSITITGGTLLFSGTNQPAVNRLNDTAPVNLAGGTLFTAGLSETVGALTLSNSSVIDLGAGAGSLRFADSSGITWSGTLSIWNWTDTQDKIFFGNGSGTGLTSTQISQIQFYTDSGTTPILTTPTMALTGELVPVPEPGSLVTFIGLLSAIAWKQRRQRV